jgi:hypothetical protein
LEVNPLSTSHGVLLPLKGALVRSPSNHAKRSFREFVRNLPESSDEITYAFAPVQASQGDDEGRAVLDRWADLFMFNLTQTPGRVQDAMRNDAQLMIGKSAVYECLFTVVGENNYAIPRPHEVRSQTPLVVDRRN